MEGYLTQDYLKVFVGERARKGFKMKDVFSPRTIGIACAIREMMEAGVSINEMIDAVGDGLHYPHKAAVTAVLLTVIDMEEERAKAEKKL